MAEYLETNGKNGNSELTFQLVGTNRCKISLYGHGIDVVIKILKTLPKRIFKKLHKNIFGKRNKQHFVINAICFWEQIEVL